MAESGLRVAFVESRDKTELFQAIARDLSVQKFWLVQNAVYTPRVDDDVTVMPYPKKRDLHVRKHTSLMQAHVFGRVSASDRVVLYFGRDTRHYVWYFNQINAWFDRVRPDVIFGEAGAFFSHMVALIADDRGIPFLNPLSSRYPTGRFSFFESDRLVPVGGEGASPNDGELEVLVNDINAGRIRPDYMSAGRTRIDALKARLRLLLEWTRGERFTAQSPLLFAKSSRALAQSRTAWDASASPVEDLIDSGRLAVLFPLQLQPEMNLDVWGNAFRDQQLLMTSLADRLAADGYELWVKPNPKSFYELNSAMVVAATEHPNIRTIAHDVRMSEIVDHVELVVTVSGSVAIERLLKSEPVAAMQPDYADWIGAPDPKKFDLRPESLGAMKIAELITAQMETTPVSVIRRLIETSYRGVISEPSYTPGVLDPGNVANIVLAFNDVISGLQRAGRIRVTA